MRTLHVAVLHGPNLDHLGRREPHLYGTVTLPEIDQALSSLAAELGATTESFQSAHEGELVEFVHSKRERCHGYLVNAAAYTHTSVALLDALLAAGLPFVEVHLTQPLAREEFRRRSLLAAHAAGVVSGFGSASYLLGLRGLLAAIREG
jgi:3-dehydroquinate dehydratase II